MKINGNKVDIKQYVEVTLKRGDGGLKLKVNSLPLGIHRDYESLCLKPTPPATVTVEKGAKRKEYNWDDPAFIEASATYRDLERYYIIWLAITGHELEIENVPKNQQSLIAFKAELKDAGFTEGDVKTIMDAALEASNIQSDEVAKARENF